MAVCKAEKSSIDIMNNGTISDDEEAASDVPPRYLFLFYFISSRFVLAFPLFLSLDTVLPLHYGTKPGHFETSKIHFPTSEGVSEVSERANK